MACEYLRALVVAAICNRGELVPQNAESLERQTLLPAFDWFDRIAPLIEHNNHCLSNPVDTGSAAVPLWVMQAEVTN